MMKNLFFFDDMITPKIITVVYWLMLIGTVLAGLGAMFSNFSIGSIFQGLIMIIGGAIGVRIWCELLIVLFKIHENLKKIADKSEAKSEAVVEES